MKILTHLILALTLSCALSGHLKHKSVRKSIALLNEDIKNLEEGGGQSRNIQEAHRHRNSIRDTSDLQDEDAELWVWLNNMSGGTDDFVGDFLKYMRLAKTYDVYVVRKWSLNAVKHLGLRVNHFILWYRIYNSENTNTVNILCERTKVGASVIKVTDSNIVRSLGELVDKRRIDAYPGDKTKTIEKFSEFLKHYPNYFVGYNAWYLNCEQFAQRMLSFSGVKVDLTQEAEFEQARQRHANDWIVRFKSKFIASPDMTEAQVRGMAEIKSDPNESDENEYSGLVNMYADLD